VSVPPIGPIRRRQSRSSTRFHRREEFHPSRHLSFPTIRVRERCDGGRPCLRGNGVPNLCAGESIAPRGAPRASEEPPGSPVRDSAAGAIP
jgi:hypothetical protein